MCFGCFPVEFISLVLSEAWKGELLILGSCFASCRAFRRIPGHISIYHHLLVITQGFSIALPFPECHILWSYIIDFPNWCLWSRNIYFRLLWVFHGLMNLWVRVYTHLLPLLSLIYWIFHIQTASFFIHKYLKVMLLFSELQIWYMILRHTVIIFIFILFAYLFSIFFGYWIHPLWAGREELHFPVSKLMVLLLSVYIMNMDNVLFNLQTQWDLF